MPFDTLTVGQNSYSLADPDPERSIESGSGKVNRIRIHYTDSSVGSSVNVAVGVVAGFSIEPAKLGIIIEAAGIKFPVLRFRVFFP